jgi:hypothetical protein
MPKKKRRTTHAGSPAAVWCRPLNRVGSYARNRFLNPNAMAAAPRNTPKVPGSGAAAGELLVTVKSKVPVEVAKTESIGLAELTSGRLRSSGIPRPAK